MKGNKPSKHISMKRLTYWASQYAMKTIHFNKKIGSDPEKYPEFRLIIGFLGYVWQHRND